MTVKRTSKPKVKARTIMTGKMKISKTPKTKTTTTIMMTGLRSLRYSMKRKRRSNSNPTNIFANSGNKSMSILNPIIAN